MSSVFKKNFTIYMCALLISYIVLALCLTQVYHVYYLDQKKLSMQEQARKISALYSSAYRGNALDQKQFQSSIAVLDKYIDYSFIIINQNSEICYLSNEILHRDFVGKKLDLKGIEKVFEGRIREYMGVMDEIFDQSVYTIAYPLMVDEQVFGAVYVNVPLKNMQNAILAAHIIITVIILFASLIAFVLLYFFTKRNLRPILQMSEAAKIIAAGDFEKRIEVRGNDEIAQLAKAFNDMAESLSVQRNMRREFISNISHDLRSPLTSIKGFSQVILDGTESKEKNDYYLKIIHSEAERLTKLANSILLLNNLDYHPDDIVMAVFDINQLITDTLMQFEDRINEKNLDIDVDFSKGEIFVRADPEKIQRVLQNLFDNAIKFTNEKGAIKISSIIEGGKVYIKVEDTGIGLTPEECRRVFERFYKADESRGKDKYSCGLGLSIVQKMLRAHGEDITVKSQRGRGTEFEFALPLAN